MSRRHGIPHQHGPFRFENDPSGAGRIVFRGRDAKGVLDPVALDSLRSAIGEAREDDCRLVFLESRLPFLFAAGADLRMLLELTPAEAADLAKEGQKTFAALARIRKLTVAIIDGHSLGGGLDLALACDLRFATPRARFGHPGVRLGIVTGWGGTVRLPRLVGLPEARKIFYSGDAIDASEAYRIGLADRVAGLPALRRHAIKISASHPSWPAVRSLRRRLLASEGDPARRRFALGVRNPRANNDSALKRTPQP